MYSPLKNIFKLKPSKNLKYLNDKNKFSIGLLQSAGINNTKNRKYDIKKNPRNFKFLMIFILGEKERKKNIEKKTGKIIPKILELVHIAAKIEKINKFL